LESRDLFAAFFSFFMPWVGGSISSYGGAMRTWICIIVVMLACSMGGCAAGAKDVHLPVVKTYGQLLDTPPITLRVPQDRLGHRRQNQRETCTVRLGQSAVEDPQNSTVILYCLTDGFDVMAAHLVNGDTLGPLRISLRHESGAAFEEKDEIISIARWQFQTTADAQLLFALSIMIDRPGRFDIEFRTPTGDVVARTTVRGMAGKAHPWTTLFLEKEAEWDWISRSDYTFKLVEPAVVSVPGSGIVLPGLSGTDFQHYGGEAQLGGQEPSQGSLRPTDLLPLAEPTTPTLRLRHEGSDLIIESDEKIDAHRADLYFIARWWVNGKPFVPVNPAPPKDKFNEILMHYDKKVILRLQLEPEKIGAKPGELVAVQLLLCTWDVAQNQSGHWRAGYSWPRLTNRIEWTLPR
jgi:hypothetical protein